jgi:hypothetical protein
MHGYVVKLLCLELMLFPCREEPAKRVLDDPPLDVISIDNLPSVLALEASHAFADLLLPALLAYPDDKGWTEANKVSLGEGDACLVAVNCRGTAEYNLHNFVCCMFVTLRAGSLLV